MDRMLGTYAHHTDKIQFCLVLSLAMMMSFCSNVDGAETNGEADLLVLQQPFDRVILNAENGGAVVDVMLLDFPNRQVPNPIPDSGVLQLRRLSEPSTLYTVSWKAIEKIQLYEQLVLEEAILLTNVGQSAAAFATLQFLHDNYPQLEGLRRASELYLERDAMDAFSAKQYDESLAIFLSLYDSNPQHPGLAEAVVKVSDHLINGHLKTRNYAAARSVLKFLRRGFPGLALPNIDDWQAKFESGAARQMRAARSAIAEGRYAEAHAAMGRAQIILPTVPGIRELVLQIDRLVPQMVVGVSQFGGAHDKLGALECSQARVHQITQPQLIDMVDFGAEGGEYRSRWATLESNDSGLRMELRLHDASLALGLTPEKIALRLLEMASPDGYKYHEDFAALFQNVSIGKGRVATVHWQHPHVRPESLLRIPLADLIDTHAAGEAYQATASNNRKTVRYVRTAEGNDRLGPTTIVERAFPDEEQATAALLYGEVAVLDQVAPWQVERLEAARDIHVSQYRLPAVHVLLLNHSRPLISNREFRRAVCYGIDREGILNGIILGGQSRTGFRVLSGPMPAGVSLSDPLGYATKQELLPRPYDPRLASVLATVAQDSLFVQSNEASSASEEFPAQEVAPLVLVYPPDPIAKTCCQAIKSQLAAIGIPVELSELASNATSLPSNYDLYYARLLVREPLVDARRLLGPTGSAGSCSSSMSLALEEVDQARNWKQARNRLRRVHQIAYHDLPVIPLWQTVRYFAHRNSHQGIGDAPITLYQNISDWRSSNTEGDR